MRIGGVFQPNALAGKYVVSDAVFLRHFKNPLPGAVLLKTDGSPGVQQTVEKALGAYPNVQVQSRAQFEASQAASINQLLGIVYALLALAVIIALIGIVNTLMLSVFERTHEIGLLRAVGMRRRQVRAMIRSESVILSVFGASSASSSARVWASLSCRAALAGGHQHSDPGLEAGGLSDPGRSAWPACRQLAGSSCRPPRRACSNRGRLRIGI